MATRTPSEISSDIIAKLAVTAPGLSLEIGTPERKIVDAVAEAIAESQVDNYLTSTQLDIDTKSGTDLEDFVGIFSFGRLQGTYSAGEVIVSLSIPATQNFVIPAGTQFFAPATTTVASLTFNSTSTVTLNVGDTTATVPLQCGIIGVVGNVSSAAITGFSAGLSFSTVTNVESFVGGTDNETDEELRARFKKNLLRNIAGTEDFYIAICLQIAANGNSSSSGVSRVQVLGPVSDFTTQIASGAINAPITLPAKNCKYVWKNGESVSLNAGTPAETWFTNGTDYTITNGVLTAPVFTPTSSASINQFLDITYEYCSVNSRNDPINGKTNKVDIFVDGSNPQAITESLVSAGGTVPAGLSVTTGYFERLGSTPILSFPTSLVINGSTYLLGTHYVGAYDTGTNRGSEREVAGVVWPIGGSPIGVGHPFVANYTYNQTPQVLNSIFKKTKQITTDVLVHQAVNKYLRFYFVIMYNRGITPSQIAPTIVSALSTYISSLSFGAWIQFSDLATIIHNVPGVDNCRIAKTTDGAPYSASEVLNGIAVGSPFTADFQIEDNTIPVLDVPTHVVSGATVPNYDAMLIRRSFNTF